MKKVLIGVSVIVVGVAIAVYRFVGNLDSLVKNALQTCGSDNPKNEVTPEK